VTLLKKRDFPILYLCHNLSCHTLHTHWILAYLGLDILANKHTDFRTSRHNNVHLGYTQSSVPVLTFWVAFVKLYKTIVFRLFQCKKVRLGVWAVLHTCCSLNPHPINQFRTLNQALL